MCRLPPPLLDNYSPTYGTDSCKMEEVEKGSSRNDNEQHQHRDDVNRGPLTGIRIKPLGKIPTKESGFEDLDGFWSPSAVDNSTPATEKLVRRVQHAREKAARKENKKQDLEQRFEKYVEGNITVQVQSLGRGMSPKFSPTTGVEYASPPSTTPKWRPIGENAIATLSPVSLGSYTTPGRTDISQKASKIGEIDVDMEVTSVLASANSSKSSVEKLTTPRLLPTPARPSSDVGSHSSELTYKSNRVFDAEATLHLDQQLADSPETDYDDQEGALDDLLASSKKARDRQLSLANKLKTPSPSGFTTASEISKTPKSVSFADRIETTFESTSSADEKEEVNVGKDDKDVDSGEEIVEDNSTEEIHNNFQGSSIKEKKKTDKDGAEINAGSDGRSFNLNVDEDDESDGDGPAFQMVQEDGDIIDHVDAEDDELAMEGNDVEYTTTHSSEKQSRRNHQNSVKKKAASTEKAKQRHIQQQKSRKEKKSSKRKVHLVEEDTQEIPSRTPRQGEAPTQQYQVISVDYYKDNHSDDEERGLRRSKRAKFPPLKWWKNERLVFESGDKRESFAGLSAQANIDMPVVTKVVAALPTPAKPRLATKKVATAKKKNEGSRKRSDSDSDSVDKGSAPNLVPFDSTKLRSVSANIIIGCSFLLKNAFSYSCLASLLNLHSHSVRLFLFQKLEIQHFKWK